MAEVICGSPAELHERLELAHLPLPKGSGRSGGTKRLPSRYEYERGVRKAKEHIRAGDAFQIVHDLGGDARF